jgi:hypothetical protein
LIVDDEKIYNGSSSNGGRCFDLYFLRKEVLDDREGLQYSLRAESFNVNWAGDYADYLNGFDPFSEYIGVFDPKENT